MCPNVVQSQSMILHAFVCTPKAVLSISICVCGHVVVYSTHKRRHAHMHTPRAPPSFLLVRGWMLDLDVGCWMKILVFNCMLSASWLANEADVMNACTHMHTHMRYGNFFFKSIKRSTILMLYNMMRNAW